MSLVVGQEKGGIVALVSDTGVVEHGVQLPPKQCRPKICLCGPDIAVGFAGSPELAAKALQRFAAVDDKDYDTTTQFFLNEHQGADGGVDYLIGFNRPAPKIVKISEGAISPCISGRTAWIGDRDAFSAFQKYRTSRRGHSVTSHLEDLNLVSIQLSEENPQNKTFELLGTMRFVILDSSIKTVFGEGVAVNNVDKEFRYRSFAWVLAEKRSSLILPKSHVDATAPERSELRNFAASCFVTVPGSSVQGIAYHYLAAKITYFYWGSLGQPLVNVRIFTDKTWEEFKSATEAEFGVKWVGMLVTRTMRPDAYGLPPSKWRTMRPRD